MTNMQKRNRRGVRYRRGMDTADREPGSAPAQSGFIRSCSGKLVDARMHSSCHDIQASVGEILYLHAAPTTPWTCLWHARSCAQLVLQARTDRASMGTAFRTARTKARGMLE